MVAEKHDTLTFLFWSGFAVFAMHRMDEPPMGGGFVAFIREHFWVGSTTGDFFTADAIWLALMAIANVLYDGIGSTVVFLPMALVWERAFNALFHIGTTLCFRQYSILPRDSVRPGVSLVVLYLVCRYGVLRGKVEPIAFPASSAAALVFESVFLSSMW